jgi:pilus assembly protein Flp/PilA
MTKLLKNYFRNEHGATAIEYGMIAAAIGVALIVVIFLIGGDVTSQMETILDYI